MNQPEDFNKVGAYTELTYEQLKEKIGDAVYFVDPAVPEPERVNAPDGWEEERRAHWMKKLPSGTYIIEGGNLTLSTGKGGAIDYYIALEKALLNYK